MLKSEQTSLQAVEWLSYMQEQDICKDSEGNQITMSHAYHQGEAKFYDKLSNKYLKPDGHVLVDGKHHFFEFKGYVI